MKGTSSVKLSSVIVAACVLAGVSWSGVASAVVVTTHMAKSAPAATLPVRFHVFLSKKLSSASVTGISCPTSTWCMAVDGRGYVHEFVDGKWSAGQLVDHGGLNGEGAGEWNGVSCPTTRWCMAVSKDDGYSLYSNGSWSRPTLVKGFGSLTGVSCTSSYFCSSSFEGGGAAFYVGGSWSSTSNGIGDEQSNSPISCAGASRPPVFCMEVDDHGDYSFTTNDQHWSAAHVIDHPGGDDFSNVSCTGPNFCVAVYQNSVHIAQWDGTSWINAAHTLQAGEEGFPAISCATGGNCVAVDGADGAIFSTGGLGWEPPVIWDADDTAATAISCAPGAGSWCMAGDSGGYAYWFAWVAPRSRTGSSSHKAGALG
jgi:hypothetical protein